MEVRCKLWVHKFWQIFQVFTESKIASIGLIFIIIIVVAAIFAPFVAPYGPTKLLDTPELFGRLTELEGKTLGCWCNPEECHADYLALLVNNA